MNVEEALDYIHGLRFMSKKLGLTKTRELLKLTGNPEKNLKFIHIGGTNGKGSVSAMIAEILKSAGYKVGLFTSPFIMRFNERIMVSDENNESGTLPGFIEIPDESLARLTEKVKNAVDGMEEPPSEFEVVTVIGFLYFLETKCDIVVLEVGMGGEFDATNVIPKNELTILTNIGLDHMQYLGNTVGEIARTKSGIIKKGSDVVFYGEEHDALAEIKNKCMETGSSLIVPDFNDIKVKKADLSCQIFSYGGFEDIKMNMIGSYQRKNAAVVTEGVKVLRRRGFNIPDTAVYSGLERFKWIARLEKINDHPLTFVDGSHNPQGMRATIDAIISCLKEYKEKRPNVICVFGVMADKDVSGILIILSEIANEIICVEPVYNRAMKCEELYMLTQKICGESVKTIRNGGNVSSGIKLGISDAKENDILLCLGSLYMASEVRDFFGKQNN